MLTELKPEGSEAGVCVAVGRSGLHDDDHHDHHHVGRSKRCSVNVN